MLSSNVPAPFSHRLPVMKRRCLPVVSSTPKSLTVSRQWFEHALQCTVLCVGDSAASCSMDSSFVPTSTGAGASSNSELHAEPASALRASNATAEW